MYSGNILLCIPEACSVVLVYTNVWLESSAGELEEGEPRQDKAVSYLQLEVHLGQQPCIYMFLVAHSLYTSFPPPGTYTTHSKEGLGKYGIM